MKKLSKFKLEELAKTMPVLDESEQREIVGGTGNYAGGVSIEQMNSMIDSGTWSGGMVLGMGYVGPSTTVTGNYPPNNPMLPPPTGYYNGQNQENNPGSSGYTGVWQGNPYGGYGGGGYGGGGTSSSSPIPGNIFDEKGLNFSTLLKWCQYIHKEKPDATLYDLIGNNQTALDNGFVRNTNGSNGANLRKDIMWNSSLVQIVINDSLAGSYTEDSKGYNNIEDIYAKNEGNEQKPLYVIEIKNSNASVIRIRCENKETYQKIINIIGL